MLDRALLPGASLRLLEERDADELAALVDANRAYLARWMPWAATDTHDDTVAFIRATRRQLAEDDGLQTAIVSDGRIAGVVGLHGVSWANRSTSIGFWLAEGFQGRGIMTAAVRAYADHVFGPWDLNRIELQAAVDNARSRAVAERLGFVGEGVRRQAERFADRTHDLAVYALLAEDWRGAGGERPG